MRFTRGAVDHDFWQSRLSRFGLVLALSSCGYIALNVGVSVYLRQPSFNRSAMPFWVAAAAFAALWWLSRRKPRSPRFVRAVELSALFIGTTAFSTLALSMDLTASPDMIVRSALTCLLLVYAVYVPSTARHTLVVASLMAVPLLVCVFLAFSKWDPALHDPPAAIWRKGEVGDMAYPATSVSAALWALTAAMAASFSHTIYGLRKAVRDLRRLGQYTLEQKLGEGGMGVVYRASHAMLRRPTAVKLLLPERAGSAALARFEREVQRTAMLTHPNTVTVFDYGRTTDGVFYYAMELLEGATLEQIVLLDGPQPEERVIHLLEQVAASLAEAHDAGLIHRDIKPSNVLVVDRGGISDLVKVVDFGLVKDVGSKADAAGPAALALSQADMVTGTPLYMAPESLTAPDALDARADLYALGAVGYYLLTGTHVFSGKSIVEVCAHHLHTRPEPPSKRCDAPIAAELEALLLACLEKRPEERPSSAHVVRERLRACAAAPRWTRARAAGWWATHRGAFGSTSVSASAAATPLTLTRIED